MAEITPDNRVKLIRLLRTKLSATDVKDIANDFGVRINMGFGLYERLTGQNLDERISSLLEQALLKNALAELCVVVANWREDLRDDVYSLTALNLPRALDLTTQPQKDNQKLSQHETQYGFASEDREQAELERLYHLIAYNEEQGIQQFQETAEQLARFKLYSKLKTLMKEANSYSLQREQSKSWRNYYNSILAYSLGEIEHPAEVLLAYGDDEQADAKMRGYALAVAATILKQTQYAMQPNGMEALSNIIERSNRFLPQGDRLHIVNLMSMSDAYRRIGDTSKSADLLEQAQLLYQAQGDITGLIGVRVTQMGNFATEGNWRKVFETQQQGLLDVADIYKVSVIYNDLAGGWATAWACAGRYTEAERRAQISLSTKQKQGEVYIVGPLRDLGFALGLQNNFDEADKMFVSAVKNSEEVLRTEDEWALCYSAAILLRRNEFEEAEKRLKRSLELRQEQKKLRYLIENYAYYGLLREMKQEWVQAEENYRMCVETYEGTTRRYFESIARVGLVRVKYAQKSYADIQSTVRDAEELAQLYEYNDHLAVLRLIQGHITWEGRVQIEQSGFDTALNYYKQALIYALRYNRYILDEVLWGGDIMTAWKPIIPFCLEQADDGQRMLATLRDWWRIGMNDVGVSRSNTISLIQEGVPLVEAESVRFSHISTSGYSTS